MASYSGVTSSGFMAHSHTTIADLFADFKYESTIGLLYLDKKKADIADVNNALDKINVDLTDIVCVQRDTEKWYTRLLVKFENYARSEFERIKELDGQIISLKNGEIKMRIQDMTTKYKYVNVAGIPYEIPDDVIVNLFSRFGEVKEVRMNYYNVGLKGIATGTRKIKMVVKKNIPSVIKVGSKTLNIAYEGQTKTCYKCGLDNHMGGDCHTDVTNFVNAINDTDYPVLPQQEEQQQPAEDEQQPAEDEQQPAQDEQQPAQDELQPVQGEQHQVQVHQETEQVKLSEQEKKPEREKKPEQD